MKIYTKDSLKKALIEISQMGWIKNAREGNDGGIGNTIEDILEIEENNIPLPNAGEWELKTQRAKSTALTTLTHVSPSPRALKFVPQILLPNYGWKHKNAGKKYPESEMSFRQTMNAKSRTDRGFTIHIDRSAKKILVSFDSAQVGDHHNEWLDSVEKRIGLGELSPQPYWGFDDLQSKIRSKLVNCVYILAEVKKIDGVEHYRYSRMSMLSNFSFEKFLIGLEEGFVLVEFDARTGHDHGTKFRLRRNYINQLYEEEKVIVDLK